MLETITSATIRRYIAKEKLLLSATQEKLCLPVINRIFKKMCVGIKFPPIKVKDNLICDGHHRYVAAHLANFKLEMVPGNITSATVAVDWESVIFIEEDWDTPAKVNMLNEQDAAYNNIPLALLIALLQ